MQAFLRRSVFALMYKEKCKWCEKDRTDGITGHGKLHVPAATRLRGAAVFRAGQRVNAALDGVWISE